MSPLWRLDQTPIMPKSRYAIMARYMPKVGTRGLDMMFRTCTVQVNLDFSDEADMVRKLRVSMALQSLGTALFANSPFTEGAPNGVLSERAEIWRDTDNARSGLLPFVFDAGMSFERWVDYALDVPLYFVKRGGVYHDVAGASFRTLMAGKLDQLPGERATLSDWANHLSTLFPDVRLKRFLEMRGADVGDERHILALSAFFTGLLYDPASVQGALDLIAPWSVAQLQALRDDVPRLGLAAHIGGRSLQNIAREVLALARAGLARRARLNHAGADETIYLDVLEERIASGTSAAQHWLERFAGPWGGDVRPVFDEARIPASAR
jgi:glutamate--cysteine ligase